MILRKTGIAIVLALLAVCVWAAPIFAQTAAPAPVGGQPDALYTGVQSADPLSGAIHRVSDSRCKARSDFMKLWNGTTIAKGVCFAGNGTMHINVYNVYDFTAGNNAGYVLYKWFDGNTYVHTFCQKDRWNYSPYDVPDVIQVTITGRTC